MRSGADGWMLPGRTDGLSRLERLMVTHRRYIILERMWDGMGERKEGKGRAVGRAPSRLSLSMGHGLDRSDPLTHVDRSKINPILTKFTQPLTGLTGQTR